MNKLSFANPLAVSLPINEQEANAFLAAVEKGENAEFSDVEVAWVNEEEIVRINKEFLKRDYVTDVITFRLDEQPDSKKAIEGSICACAPRIEEQAKEFSQPVKREFARVTIHGLLHLVGYEDETDELKKEMQQREDFYLQQLNLM
jgi:rRNA maturation RNase YbeY